MQAEITPDLFNAVRGRARRIGMLRDVDPDELESDALFALARATQDWTPDGGASYRSYVFQRVGWAITDSLRRHGWVGRTGSLGPRSEQPLEIDRSDERDVFSRADSRLDLVAELGPLPPRKRAIVLKHLAGHTLAEIARAEGCSEVRIHRLWKEALWSIIATRRRCLP